MYRIVMTSPGNDITNAARRIGHIVGVAGNEMDMHVQDGLPRGLPHVDPYIVP